MTKLFWLFVAAYLMVLVGVQYLLHRTAFRGDEPKPSPKPKPPDVIRRDVLTLGKLRSQRPERSQPQIRRVS
jgi:hypothetical protein